VIYPSSAVEITPFAIEQRTLGDHTFGMKVGQKRKTQLSRLNTSAMAIRRPRFPSGSVRRIEGDDDTLALQLAQRQILVRLYAQRKIGGGGSGSGNFNHRFVFLAPSLVRFVNPIELIELVELIEGYDSVGYGNPDGRQVGDKFVQFLSSAA
jgi:hypothetical protein